MSDIWQAVLLFIMKIRYMSYQISYVGYDIFMMILDI